MKTYSVFVGDEEGLVIAGRYTEKDAAISKVSEMLGAFIRVEVFEVDE